MKRKKQKPQVVTAWMEVDPKDRLRVWSGQYFAGWKTKRDADADCIDYGPSRLVKVKLVITRVK